MDLSSHGVERLREEALHGVKICEVALDSLDRASCCRNGVGGLVIGGVRPADKTDVRSGFSESNGAGSTDACWR